MAGTQLKNVSYDQLLNLENLRFIKMCSKPITIWQLCNEMNLEYSTVYRRINKLCEGNLIEVIYRRVNNKGKNENYYISKYLTFNIIYDSKDIKFYTTDRDKDYDYNPKYIKHQGDKIEIIMEKKAKELKTFTLRGLFKDILEERYFRISYDKYLKLIKSQSWLKYYGKLHGSHGATIYKYDSDIEINNKKNSNKKTVQCIYCNNINVVKCGKHSINSRNVQRYKCKDCEKRFIVDKKLKFNPLDYISKKDLYSISSRELQIILKNKYNVKISYVTISRFKKYLSDTKELYKVDEKGVGKLL